MCFSIYLFFSCKTALLYYGYNWTSICIFSSVCEKRICIVKAAEPESEQEGSLSFWRFSILSIDKIEKDNCDGAGNNT